MVLRFFLFCSLLLSLQSVSAQDTVHVTADTIPAAKIHSPLFAGIASAVLPGAGQVYNGKIWKVPIVYAALATAGYFTYFNGKVYFAVHNNLNSRVAGDSTPSPQFLILNSLFSKTTIDLNGFSYDDLQSLQDDYRKNFALSIIAGSAVYMLNILDAVVDAHLYHFDVSDNLSLNFTPQLFYSPNALAAPGFTAQIQFRR